MAEADTARLLVRLLKSVNGAGRPGCRWSRKGSAICLHLAEKTVTIPSIIVQLAERRGLIVLDDVIRLTAEGRSSLIRLLDPENGYRAQNGNLACKCTGKAGASTTQLVNESESPLQRLHARKSAGGGSWIGHDEFQAGERLRKDFEQAGLGPRISANWIASVSSGSRDGSRSGDITDFALDARRRLENALQAIGPELSGVAMDVCCFLKGLECVERERRWPPRSAKLMLKTALSGLVRHYGLSTAGGKRAVRQWGSSDYRPEIRTG